MVVGVCFSANDNCPHLVSDNLRATVGNGTRVDAVTRGEMFSVVLDSSGVSFERRELPE